MGNLQVRFLEGWTPAMAPGYSTTIQKRGSRKLAKATASALVKTALQRGAVRKLASNLVPSTGLSVSIARCCSSICASPATGRQSPDGDAASGKFSKQLRHSRRNFTVARDDYRPFQVLSKLS